MTMKKKEVYLASPISSKEYTFILSFADESNYKTIRSEIYNNRDKIIVVAGRWTSSGKYNKFISKVWNTLSIRSQDKSGSSLKSHSKHPTRH